jgi:tetratricopeptide (TPR) repeat protein
MPENRERAFGPARLTESHSLSEAGVLTADLRFDTGKATYSTDDVQQIREELAVYYKETMPQVVFYQVGEAHLAAGRLLEALREFQDLVRRHPQEALYHTQVARAYLAAGLGSTARREAARAVDLAPDSMIAHRTQGLILAHDRLGRKFQPGIDREGAERALRRARELAPDDFIARGELAILLEHDAEGRRYATGARLDEAILEYQAIRADLEDEGLTSNLMVDLLYTGRFDEVRSLWKEAPRDRTRNGLYIAAIAATGGPDEAIAEASRIHDKPEGYRADLIGGSEWLRKVRRYPEAAALLAAGARGDSESVARLALADLLRGLQRHESLAIDRGTPQGTVQAFLRALILAEASTPPIGFFLPGPVERIEAERVPDLIEAMDRAISGELRQKGGTREAALDWVLSLGRFSVDGDAGIGDRVHLQIPQPSGSGPSQWTFYLVRHGDGHRIVGLTHVYPMIGSLLLEWIDAGQAERAGRWLDWLAEDTAGLIRGEDVLQSLPLEWLWIRGRSPDRTLARAAAASLMVDGSCGARPIEILQGLAGGVPEGEPRTGVDLALAIGGGENDLPELMLEAGRRLMAAHPRSRAALSFVIAALVELERFEEAEKEIEAKQQRWGPDPLLGSLWADLARIRGNLEENRRRLQAHIASGRASFGDYNNLAWLDIIEERVTEESLQAVQQAVTMSNYAETSALHTLATVYAEMGQVAEARDVLLALIENRSSNELESPDWYVLGRIAEQYGAFEEALAAYREVEPPEDGRPDLTSTHVVAARRIAALASSRSGR